MLSFKCIPDAIFMEKKTFKNVKKGFTAALKSTETRKSKPCPLRIGWASAKSYGNLFYTPKSLPCCQKKILLIALLSMKILQIALLSEEFFLLIAKNEAMI